MFMKILRLLFLMVFLTGCSAAVDDTPSDMSTSLPNLGKAPELTNETWLNTTQPLRMADLRGKVVLIDMWTYG